MGAKIIRTTEWKVRPEDEKMLEEHYRLYYQNKKRDSFYRMAIKHLKAWLKKSKN